jgi:hypothetical protein
MTLWSMARVRRQIPAKEARTIYEGYVRRNQDPALLEWVGYGMFQTSVFPVPPGAERKVTLKFSQLLRKDHQLTDLMIPLSTAKYTSAPVEKLSLNVAIETTAELKSVYSPTHNISIERPDNKHAKVKFEATNTIPTSDFRVLFDTVDGKLGASLISFRPDSGDDGFFLLLASPEVKAETSGRRNGGVCRRRSGSMAAKNRAGKEALKFVLNNCNKETCSTLSLTTARSKRQARAKVRRRDAQSGPQLRRWALCRRQHEYRWRADHRAGHDQGRFASELCAVHDRRPADRWRDERSQDRRQHQAEQQAAGADDQLRRRLRPQ